METSVRQKSRWTHGIAFQGWDRLGWSDGWADLWMALRDRRGPLTAIVLACGYMLVVVEGLLALAGFGGIEVQPSGSPVLRLMLQACFVCLAWRCAFRFAFTAREYGALEGISAIVRIPVANYIAILAGRRALAGYVGSLRGVAVRWDKTSHDRHPAWAQAQ